MIIISYDVIRSCIMTHHIPHNIHHHSVMTILPRSKRKHEENTTPRSDYY